jgi:hypothetical protein
MPMTMTAPPEKILTPVAPPRVFDGVYREEEYERMLGLIKREGPWGTIISHHFETVDEVIATVSGVIPPDHGLTLDDIAGPHFRGFFAKNSVCFYPELEDIFFNSRFLAEVRSYWGAQYAKPTLMLFNICGPHETGLAPHLDAVTFRGVRIENTPVWLQNIMGKSGLFREYLVKMAQVITWWYRGSPGGFTYWPDGPYAQPKVLEAPMWNRGVVVQNEMMYHRGDPVGPRADRAIEGMKNRSVFGYDADDDSWAVTTDGEVIKRYEPEQIRLLVHWNAEVYADMDEVRKVMDHTDDLTHEQVVDTLLADMRERGQKVATPSNPLHDVDFIQALLHTYDVQPTTDWLQEGA